ncbi:MAG: hypothetical protein J6P37_05670 [Lachnospiraceae bacterium]|nr:hypothetical protein [Lachnospiraceae bacterium]
MDNNPQNYNNYYYGEMNNYEVVPQKKNVCGILSFIFSMVAVVIMLISCCGIMLATIPYIGWILGFMMQFGNFLIVPLLIAGFILGIIGVNKKDQPKGLAKAGLIISIVIFVLWLLAVILIVVLMVLATLGIVTTGIFAGLSQYLNQLNTIY